MSLSVPQTNSYTTWDEHRPIKPIGRRLAGRYPRLSSDFNRLTESIESMIHEPICIEMINRLCMAS